MRGDRLGPEHALEPRMRIDDPSKSATREAVDLGPKKPEAKGSIPFGSLLSGQLEAFSKPKGPPLGPSSQAPPHEPPKLPSRARTEEKREDGTSTKAAGRRSDDDGAAKRMTAKPRQDNDKPRRELAGREDTSQGPPRTKSDDDGGRTESEDRSMSDADDSKVCVKGDARDEVVREPDVRSAEDAAAKAAAQIMQNPQVVQAVPQSWAALLMDASIFAPEDTGISAGIADGVTSGISAAGAESTQKTATVNSVENSAALAAVHWQAWQQPQAAPAASLPSLASTLAADLFAAHGASPLAGSEQVAVSESHTQDPNAATHADDSIDMMANPESLLQSDDLDALLASYRAAVRGTPGQAPATKGDAEASKPGLTPQPQGAASHAQKEQQPQAAFQLPLDVQIRPQSTVTQNMAQTVAAFAQSDAFTNAKLQARNDDSESHRSIRTPEGSETGRLADIRDTAHSSVQRIDETTATHQVRTERVDSMEQMQNRIQMMIEQGGKASEVKVDTQFGAVRVRVEMDGNRVNIKFATEQAQAQVQIRAGLDDLTKRLSNQGFKMGDVTFSGAGQSQTQADARQNQARQHREEMLDESVAFRSGARISSLKPVQIRPTNAASA